MACVPSHVRCRFDTLCDCYELAAFVNVLIMLLFIVSHLCGGNVFISSPQKLFVILRLCMLWSITVVGFSIERIQ